MHNRPATPLMVALSSMMVPTEGAHLAAPMTKAGVVDPMGPEVREGAVPQEALKAALMAHCEV
jgi:hypothetical protein